MLPGFDVAPPSPDWGPEEIAIDVFHHLVYAAAFAVRGIRWRGARLMAPC
ncbi:MAG TPA: hypothetical protein VF148_04970 [Acidimicrobiia bacterium]